jgi:hypothetical protein
MNKWLLSFDTTSVVVFVLAGRSTHNQAGTTGALRTEAPFLIALGIGWIVTRAWNDPASIRTGLGVVASTFAIGMVLRRLVFDDGTALSFVLVTAAFLTLTLMGWRMIVLTIRRRSPSGLAEEAAPLGDQHRK